MNLPQTSPSIDQRRAGIRRTVWVVVGVVVLVYGGFFLRSVLLA